MDVGDSHFSWLKMRVATEIYCSSHPFYDIPISNTTGKNRNGHTSPPTGLKTGILSANIKDR